MRLAKGLLVLALCLVGVFSACRRNQPSLVDRNEAPDTELWYAPADSSEYQYLAHIYWRGRDNDGTVEKYIWTIRDTLTAGELQWNPAQRLSDFRSGRIIERTDSIFAFTAFRNVAGVGVKKNRQAFSIASIDDNGVIDPSPAEIEFVATIETLPRIRFAWTDEFEPDPGNPGQQRPINFRPWAFETLPKDTVGVMKPFAITYSGTTTNGAIVSYQWFPLATEFEYPGARIWTEDLSDTTRVFRNTTAEPVSAGVFRFAVQTRDEADAESPVDAGRFQEGVCQIVVNFDPETTIREVFNNYTTGGTIKRQVVDFTDGVADTVPFGSWLDMRYSGRDDPRDVQCCSDLNPDRCIDFQIKYERISDRVIGSFESSGWLPRAGVHDTDATSATDSNTVNIGSLEYDLFVRAIDTTEPAGNARGADGHPASIHIVGNYNPTLDSVAVVDHFGEAINLAVHDTLTWKFYKGEGWPYTSLLDTIDLDPLTGQGTRKFIKRFSWYIQGWGHDHPKDPDGSGVKAWRYIITNKDGTMLPIARSGLLFNNGVALNQLDDQFQLTFRYPSALSDSVADHTGETVFANLPSYFDDDLRIRLIGRDTGVSEPQFQQYAFWSLVPAEDEDTKQDCNQPKSRPPEQIVSTKNLINSFPTSNLGRYTKEETFEFYFRMVR